MRGLLSRFLNGASFRILALVVPALAAGCSPPPPPPPTVVYVKLVATADVNATGGVGAPLLTRVYQLAGKSSFEGAEFFPLYKTDSAVLGTDLVKKDEVLLAPGTTKILTLSPTDQVQAVGVFAAYQSYATSTWRADADVPPHATTTITVTAGATGVTVTTAPGKPAGS
jgi:type VI secretion system protein VasD